jgi:hypothetical protein
MSLESIMCVHPSLKTYRIRIHLCKPTTKLDFQMFFDQQLS